MLAVILFAFAHSDIARFTRSDIARSARSDMPSFARRDILLRKVYASLSLSIKLPKAISRAAGAYHREAISRGESRI